jgi:6-phosphogluconate dehydrogenase
MQLGMIGLGRMGLNMARRLLAGGHEVVVYNRSPDKIKLAQDAGAAGATTPAALVARLRPPRVVWLMLPAGQVTQEHVALLAAALEPGDLLVEGGNSFYQDDVRRAAELRARGLHYLDAGVSGGIWGLEKGYCTMVGGDLADFQRIEPLLQTLAPANGYLYCGPAGAGHYVKMIHNGIEYAMMEAYGEGFEVLKASPYGAQLNLADVARLWNQGSVVRSWLLELLEAAFRKDGDLAGIPGYVEDSGEARWTVQEAVARGVDATGIAHSLFKRFLSRQDAAFSNKVVAALRREFGGHAIAAPTAPPAGGAAGAGQVQPARPAAGGPP